jgi:large conductance mechanosensitive channel
MRRPAGTPKVQDGRIEGWEGWMLKGFRDFIARGNVIDLAVAVVIGAAFTNVVNAFSSSFLEPLIKVISGGKELSGSFTIAKVKFEWSAFVNAVIAFLIAAATVYFLVVLPMNKLAERRKRGEEPEPEAPSDEVRLLTEIRDALVAQRGVRGVEPSADEPPTMPPR